MSKVNSSYTYLGQPISYEILSNGYSIYLNNFDMPWITQSGANAKMYVPSGTYEQNAVEQIRILSLVKEYPDGIETDIDNLQQKDIDTDKEIYNLKNNKVDKEEGKGLSANNYTDNEKQILSSLDEFVNGDLKKAVKNNTENITTMNTTIVSFGLYVDADGYLCQSLKDE